jgi:fluoride exporter
MSHSWTITAAVAAGSGLGGSLRHATGLLFASMGWSTLPWATLCANVLGSMLIGWFAAAVAHGHFRTGPVGNHFVITGVLGGYTTYSIFSLETLALLQGGAWPAGLANIALTLILCLLAVTLGYRMGAGDTLR